ncbi:hypothetical protein [Dechloromonas sp. HYN0024]|uniref:hypothetical protein n=1 Tax=Dechloromonas sp. HYN0024 TaxID=2231055 RepID=UPI0013C36DDD|nr:hypothetical protein [Dechloromonas sp. HYN0024]
MTPLITETVALFKANADPDGLTPKLKEWNSRYEVGGWASAYEEFGNFLLIHLSALPVYGNPLESLAPLLVVKTLNDLQDWADQTWQILDQVLDDDSDDAIDAATMGLPELIPGITVDDDSKPISRQALFITVALIVVFNHFACMVHRKSLFQLVAEAKAGDDESLLKAIQIDKQCLADIPYFQERLIQAAIAGEDNFVRRLMQYRKKPAFQTGTALQPLYLVLSLLDGMGLLDAYLEDFERFADLCQELGIYGPDNDACDTESLAKTVRRFKAKYRSLAPSQKIAWVIKDTV